jgi:hypothetical protein
MVFCRKTTSFWALNSFIYVTFCSETNFVCLYSIEAEFLDVIRTKALRVFLLAIAMPRNLNEFVSWWLRLLQLVPKLIMFFKKSFSCVGKLYQGLLDFSKNIQKHSVQQFFQTNILQDRERIKKKHYRVLLLLRRLMTKNTYVFTEYWTNRN